MCAYKRRVHARARVHPPLRVSIIPSWYYFWGVECTLAVIGNGGPPARLRSSACRGTAVAPP
eukprot:1054103-Pyramimonas_sp.AAC.1